MPIINPTARQVADEFKKVLREWLTTEQLAEVDHRNNARADSTCATHDFCDANMAMLEALQNLTGQTEDEVSDRLLQVGPLLDAVNDGWTLAKVEGFYPDDDAGE